LYPTVLLVAIVVAFYVRIGGEICDIFLDLVQGVMLTVAGLVLFLLGVYYVGGFNDFWHLLPAEAKLPLADFNKPPDFNLVGIFWQDGIAGSIGFLFLNQALIMRFMSCKSVVEGRKAAAVNALFFLPVSAIVVSNAGWIAKAISISHPELIPPDFKPLDDIFVKVNFLVAKPGVAGFIAAALIAALLSTVDSLINATTAIFIFDVYKPIRKKELPDKHYLDLARWITLVVTAVAVGLVPLFHSFGTIYKAHGWFHSTVIPPLVVAVFMGIIWPKFTTKAAVWTFLGGGVMIVLGQIFPQLVTPFAHGTPMEAGKPYIFIGAFYNLLCCAVIGIVVSLLTKPQESTVIDGLTIWTIKSAKRIYKGAEPNEIEGRKILVNWKNYSGEGMVARFAIEDMESLKAETGDLVYLCDKRWWLGGLKSVHAKIGEPHSEKGIVYITEDIISQGLFTARKSLTAEKEM
jgi:SSS family solute:Na+ symporter